jgi:hypothetical protein
MLRKFAGSGGTLVSSRVVSTGGVPARPNTPRRTPSEQSPKPRRRRGVKIPDWEMERLVFILWSS